MVFFNRAILLILLAFVFAGCQSGKSQHIISLSGTWKFKADPNEVGVMEKWYDVNLSGTIVLPGSMASNNMGVPVNYDTEFIGNNWIERHIPDFKWYEDERFKPYLSDDEFLYPFWLISDKYYLGMAWYQKDVEVPESWVGKNVELFLERCHWETQVWVNNVFLGKQNSLGTPHRYNISEALTPGVNRITIAVDNRIKDIDVGADSHSVSDNTQTSWNGIIGDIKLIRRDSVNISNVRIFPDIEKRMAKVEITITHLSSQSPGARLKMQARTLGKGKNHKAEPFFQEIDLVDGKNKITIDYPMGEGMLLWDEFNPNVYQLSVELEAGESYDKVTENFGMRNFGIEGTQFSINGRPVFLRGTLESAIFPLTGYPPTDIASWERIMKICRNHGLNHLRFHSWCPPKAAFEAADKIGFYLQVEASSWAHVGYGNPIDQWLYDETQRMLDAYGNHPSFVMMTHGNEPHGQYREEYLAKYLNYWKSKDPRRLYTAGAGWPVIPESDYHNSAVNLRIQGWGQQLNSIVNRLPPQTNFDWSNAVNSSDKPIISHEIGQWCVYPNFNEIEKYTGVMKPANFRLFKRSLQAKGLSHLADSFLLASGKLQTLLYKADIEAALRTRGLAGFQLLDLQDFSGQGTALVGIVDAFWQEKGYVSPGEFRRFCNTTVPLARLDRRVFYEGDTLSAKIEVAHFGKDPLNSAKINWEIIHNENTISKGILPSQNIPLGNGIALGDIEYPLENLGLPRKLTLQVNIEDFTNSWDFWVYPYQQPKVPSSIRIAEEIDSETIAFLENGGKVLLSLGRGRVVSEMGGEIGVGFSTIFWNTAWTNNQKPHTLGILCNPDHPALASFPTEFHSNWQWWDAMTHSDALRLDKLAYIEEPIVRIIDDWFFNRSLALIFEVSVGNGQMIISGVDLVNNLENRKEAIQLRTSLLDYMAMESFNPGTELSFSQLMGIVK